MEASMLLMDGFKALDEHRRSNHLHREGVAQALRLHEADAHAAKEYHRKEVQLCNDQHARGILQARVQHEEDIDLEKRGAIRENIRDEWMQLSDKAETVFIVNTLVLGSSFIMLIEGELPEAIALQHQVLLVAYFSALSSSICLLLCSVRFAMVLRFRVQRTIVEEMRVAIETTKKQDAEFRQRDCYKKCNRAKIIPSACDCDDPRVRRRVQSYPWQMAHPVNGRETDHSDSDHEGEATVGQEELQAPAFLTMPDANTYQNLAWLRDASGFSGEHMLFCHNRRRDLSGAGAGGLLRGVCRHRRNSKGAGPRLGHGGLSDGGASHRAIGAEACGSSIVETGEQSAAAAGFSGGASSSSAGGLGGAGGLPRTGSSASLPSDHTDRSQGSGTSQRSRTSQEDTSLSIQVSEGDLQGHLPPAPPPASSPTAWLRHRWHQTYHAAAGGGRSGTDGESEEDHEPMERQDSDTEALGGDAEIAVEELDDWQRDYRMILNWRRKHNDELQEKLDKLRENFCTPWDDMAQYLFFSGTLTLLIASCCLVFGRFGYDRIGSDDDVDQYPAAPVASAAFCTPCVLTVGILIYLERPLKDFREQFKRQYVRAQTPVSPDSSGAVGDGAGRTTDDRCGPSAIAVMHPESDDVLGRPTPIRSALARSSQSTRAHETLALRMEDAGLDKTPLRVGASVSVLMALNFVGYVSAAGAGAPAPGALGEETSMSSRAHVASLHEGWDGGAIASGNERPSEIRATPLPLPPGATWPRFWEPSGIAWWPTRQALLLVGGNELIELSLSNSSFAHFATASPLRVATASGTTVADVCIVHPPDQEPRIWMALNDEDEALALLSASGSFSESDDTLSTTELQGAYVFGSSSQGARVDRHGASSHPVLSCRPAADHTGAAEPADVAGAYFWLATTSTPWPTLVSATVGGILPVQNSTATQPRLRFPLKERWPTAWLLEQPSLLEAFSWQRDHAERVASQREIVLEAIDTTETGVLLLVSRGGPGALLLGRPPLQVLAFVDRREGQFRGWRRLAPAAVDRGSGAAGAGSVGPEDASQWVALAADRATDRVFLATGGPTPQVAVAPLPSAWTAL